MILKVFCNYADLQIDEAESFLNTACTKVYGQYTDTVLVEVVISDHRWTETVETALFYGQSLVMEPVLSGHL